MAGPQDETSGARSAHLSVSRFGDWGKHCRAPIHRAMFRFGVCHDGSPFWRSASCGFKNHIEELLFFEIRA